jgi:hypothetical protein
MMRPTLLVLLVPLLPACTSWQPVELPAPMASEWSTRGLLRLTTDRGVQLRGDSAWIAGDTLRFRAYRDSTASVPRARVAGIERNGIDQARTTGLGFGLAAMFAIMVLVGNAIEDSISVGFGGTTWAGAP